MRSMTVKLVLFSMIVVLSSVGAAMSEEAVQTTTAPAIQVVDNDLVPDPFLDQSGITSSTVTASFCICAYGINCCGDLPDPRKCSINGSCRCNSQGDCLSKKFGL
jgi:hypothetical protein